MRRPLAWLLVIGAASCAGSPPAAGPVGASPLASAQSSPPPIQPPAPPPTATVVPDAPSPAPAPEATAEPPRPLPIPEPECAPPHTVQVPARFATLFEKGRRSVYFMHDEVDTHSVTDPHVSTKVEITCVVRALHRFKKAAASEVTCVPPHEGVAVLPSSGNLVYVASDQGLWVSDALPADEEAVKKILATPPFLARNPVQARHHREQPGMFEGQKDQCEDAVEIEGPFACHHTQCAIVQGYGDTVDRWCFSKAHGLETMRQENLDGPRTTTWELVSVKPKMPIPACPKEE